MFKTTQTAKDHVELYTPPQLEPYMKRAREIAGATAEDTAWAVHLEARVTGLVSWAIAATEYGGVTPGSVPPLATYRRQMPVPVREGSFVAEWKDQVAPEDIEHLRRYHASEDARGPFAEAVQETVRAILSDPQRAHAAHKHMIALDEATRMLQAEAAQAEADAARRAQWTDPITGHCEPSHGAITARPAIAGTTLSVQSSALTHLLVQQRLAQRILEQHPDLAGSVDQVVDRLIREASL